MKLADIEALFKDGTVLTTQWDNGKQHTLHIIHRPTVFEKGFYRQTTSFGAFINREKTASMKHTEEGRYCLGDWNPKTWIISRNCDKFSYDKHNLGPIPAEQWDIVEHKSVWAFYRYIGYDYKKKRYL